MQSCLDRKEGADTEIDQGVHYIQRNQFQYEITLCTNNFMDEKIYPIKTFDVENVFVITQFSNFRHRSVPYNIHRLEIQSVMSVYSTQLCELLPF